MRTEKPLVILFALTVDIMRRICAELVQASLKFILHFCKALTSSLLPLSPPKDFTELNDLGCVLEDGWHLIRKKKKYIKVALKCSSGKHHATHSEIIF